MNIKNINWDQNTTAGASTTARYHRMPVRDNFPVGAGEKEYCSHCHGLQLVRLKREHHRASNRFPGKTVRCCKCGNVIRTLG